MTTDRLTREVAMTAARVAVRRCLTAVAVAVLCVPYALGCIGGLVVVAALTVGTATRLGWQDVRKWGDRGTA